MEKKTKEFEGYKGTQLLTQNLHDSGYKTEILAEWKPLVDVYGRYFDKAESVPLVWRDGDVNNAKGEHTPVTESNYHVGTILSKTDSNFVFVHIDSVDEDGHTYGWDSSQYAKGVRQLDDKISLILKGLMKRENINNEEWVIGITPDHGGVNYGHSENKNPLVFNTYFIALHWNKGEWNLVTLKNAPGMTIAGVLPRLMAQSSVVNKDVTVDVSNGQTLHNISSYVNKDSWVRNIISDHALTKKGEGLLLISDNTKFSHLNQQEGITKLLAAHYFNQVNINGGKLIVQGTLDSQMLHNRAILVNNGLIRGNTVLESGSHTFGTGKFDGDLIIMRAATVAPGNSIGHMQVAGNVLFANGSNYDVEISADGQSDQINTDGVATITGGRVNVSLTQSGDSLSLQDIQQLQGKEYTILTAKQGIVGRFEQVSPNYLFLGTDLNYQPGKVLLHVGRNQVAFADVALTSNERSVARAAEALMPGNPVYDTLLKTYNVEDARRSFRELSGQVHADILPAVIHNSRYLRDALNSRLLAPNSARTSTDIHSDESGSWVKLLGAWGHSSGNSETNGFNSSTGGILLGLDTESDSGGQIGIAGGYTRTSLNDGNGSTAGLDSYHLALYAGQHLGEISLRAGAGNSWGRVNTSRNIHLGQQTENEKSKYKVDTSQIFVEAGYNIDLGSTSIEPFSQLSWIHVKKNAFKENGGAAALRGEDQHSNVALSVLGGRTSSEWKVGVNSKLSLNTSLGWQHEYTDRSRTVRLNFRQGTTPFLTNAVASSRDGMLVKTGFDLELNNSTHLMLGYAGLISKSYQDNSVNAGLTWRF
ncbi:autotransporter domain-containing protein [Type-D symbiont of Plautia stali]|uniref:autotransporter domain-containing protein n=1 Tax=Type-D symbiont of Plautia stali TaxID=1560356 RepID=UPI00073F7E97|nr:autotransporter domain-containing protein [Type-D symbiont of Plautia stali]